MEQPKEETNNTINNAQESTFEFFTKLDPELHIYILNILLFEIIEKNPSPVKALKKALNFIHFIKTVNHNFYNYRTELYRKLKELLVQKFVSSELLKLNQDQKNNLLKACLASAQELKFGTPNSELTDEQSNIEKLHKKVIECILVEADPEIIIAHFVNHTRCRDLEVDFLIEPIFLAMCYGAKLDALPDQDKNYDVKTVMIAWAVENLTSKLLKVIKFILKSNLDPNTIVYGRGGNWKLLHMVAFKNDYRYKYVKATNRCKLKSVELLLQFGAKKDLKTDPDGSNNQGYTAYDLAKRANPHNKKMLDLLYIDEQPRKTKERCIIA